MKNYLGDNLPIGERAGFLRDNCDTVEEKSYFKKFSEQEISSMKDELSEVSITMNDIEEEKKEETKKFTLKLEPLKKDKKLLLTNIKLKGMLVSEETFKFIDYENDRVGYYNQVGELIDSRPLLPHEHQKSIFPIRATGTDDEGPY